MKLEGIHHITAITADAQPNVDFYAGVMGLRLVKKTVNQDQPTVYHLFYADEKGSAGSDLTFFEFPGVPDGRPGAGDVHRIVWRVASAEPRSTSGRSVSAPRACRPRREGDGLVFSDPEGLEHELLVVEVDDAPLIADHPEIPSELALQGFHAARAYAAEPEASRPLLESLEFEQVDGAWEARGDARRRALALRRAAGGALDPGRRKRPPHRLGIDDRRARGVARAGDRRRRPADPGDRSLLLQVDLLPRAEWRSLRDRDARPGVHGRRAARVASARSSRCRRTSSTCATQVEPNLRPVVNPRAADFVWRDAGRTVVFREDAVATAPAILAEHGWESFELLTTERALSGAADLREAAAAVHGWRRASVPDGRRGTSRRGRRRAPRRPRRRPRDRHRQGGRRDHRRRGRGVADHPLRRRDDRDPPASRRRRGPRPVDWSGRCW